MPSLKKSEGKKITDDFVRLLFLLGSKSCAAELLSSMVPLEGGPVREGSRSGRYGGGVARTEQLRDQYTAGKRARWCETEKMAEQCVVICS
jgi:hypothetical protein